MQMRLGTVSIRDSLFRSSPSKEVTERMFSEEHLRKTASTPLKTSKVVDLVVSPPHNSSQQTSSRLTLQTTRKRRRKTSRRSQMR